MGETKQAISWVGLVQAMKKKMPTQPLKDAMQAAGKEWKSIKAGTHEKYVQGKSDPVTRKKKPKPKPGHKGAPSKTRPGKIDYMTHAGDKFYHRDGKLEDENVAGVKGRPYAKHKTHKHKTHKHKTSKKHSSVDRKKHEKIIKELQKIIAELKK